MEILGENSGTGSRFQSSVIISAGVSALAASLLTFVAIWLQFKNYRKPLLQRYVVRILIMVPIYSAASWASLVSIKTASWIDPIRDAYEAFTIYAFFQLLINFIGGERALIIMMHGRPPISHPWPLSRFLSKVDISDPYTFLAIKRGILQYTWIKPMLAIATIAMKATGTYKEGVIALNSGYLWSGLIYNVSISVSLYALAIFWICMNTDLKPFRPMPKFLSIKGIIFASYWQGFGLSILVFLSLIPGNVPGYTKDNLAAAIQDALICFEMPLFAILHWYAFSWHDYADITISSARMPVKYALRDAFGPRDLIQDAKETFAGSKYEYRYFDAGDDVLAHEESGQRVKRMMEGMRYERGGKGKYWIPKPGRDSKTPLLRKTSSDGSPSESPNGRADQSYGTTSNIPFEEPFLDSDDECMYANARALEFGDYHYPVILAHRPRLEERIYQDPRILTTSTNRNILQPTKANKSRRKAKIEEIQDSVDNKGKHDNEDDTDKTRTTSQSKSKDGKSHRPPSDASSSASGNSELVDLVVEDEVEEAVDRVRARKDGSPEWNKTDTKHFVQVYPDSDQEEAVREGHEPTEPNKEAQHLHTVDTAFRTGEQGERSIYGEDESQHWKQHDYTDEPDEASRLKLDDLPGESNVWDSPKR